MTEVIELIGSLGFPVFITLWLLYDSCKRDDRFEKMIIEFKDTINKNTTALMLLKSEMKHKQIIEEEIAKKDSGDSSQGGKQWLKERI